MNTRREFILGACATGAAAVARPLPAASEAERLRIGILSDLHLETEAQRAKLERALACFRDRRADGVLICGDLADHGILPELRMLADTWKKIFPGDRLPDGTHIEKLFHYGDHDTGDYAHKREFFGSGDRLCQAYGVSYEELCSWAIARDEKKIWEELFGEPWSPIMHKRVKGYDFVLAHGQKADYNRTIGLEDFLKHFHPDPAKPFFYSQHRVYQNACGGPFTWGQDNGMNGKQLSRYPNAVCFCGHGHLSATDERAIWQGDFTAIEVPSLRYVGLEVGHENKDVSPLRKQAGLPQQMKNLDCDEAEQGMFMTVYDDRITLDRLDFRGEEPLAPSWTIPLGGRTKPYAFSERRKTAVAPEFPADAKLKLRKLDQDRFVVEFPLAQATAATPRAFDYLVEAIGLEIGGTAYRVEHPVYSPKIYNPPSKDPGPGTCVFALAEFPKDRRFFRVLVTPRNAFGKGGEPIEAGDWLR